MVCSGTQYSYAQLEGLWIQAGGAKALAPTMAAIAEAESGGCSTAYNPSGATGLWQILGAVNPADQSNLTNPAVNAHEAVLKYKSQGLGAWVTYTSGAYRAYMNGATTPDMNVPGGGGGSSSSSGSDCAFGPRLPLVGTVCLLKKTTIRHMVGGALMVAGGAVAGLGVILLAAFAFRASGAAKAAGQVASLAPGPAGKALRQASRV